MKLVCRSCAEVYKAPFKPEPADFNCPCGGTRCLPSELKPRKPLKRASKLGSTQAGATSERKSWSTLKRGRGFAASPAQQKKVRDLPCIVCGRDRHETEIHAAHVWPRTYTPCECADGVVPLCAEHHAAYDVHPYESLDLLPHLIDRGYRVEFCHAFIEHEIPIQQLLDRVTGTTWNPLARGQREGAAA